jgi:hypothetical protein
MNSIVRLLTVYAGLALLLCGFTHLDWSPLRPNGSGQWLALFLLIVPAAVAAELLGARLLGRPEAEEAEATKSHSDCSWTRIAAGTTVLLVTIAIVLSAAWWMSHQAFAG